MSALYEAVARAIAAENTVKSYGALPERQAAAAIGVVLAEATRSIEALRTNVDDHSLQIQQRDDAFADAGYLQALDEALAVLATLGEQA